MRTECKLHSLQTLGPPAEVPTLNPFLGWEGSPTKIDYRKKLVPTYSILSTGGPRTPSSWYRGPPQFAGGLSNIGGPFWSPEKPTRRHTASLSCGTGKTGTYNFQKTRLGKTSRQKATEFGYHFFEAQPNGVQVTPIDCSPGRPLSQTRGRAQRGLGEASPFFPGILLSRKPPTTLGKWLAIGKNDG